MPRVSKIKKPDSDTPEVTEDLRTIRTQLTNQRNERALPLVDPVVRASLVTLTDRMREVNRKHDSLNLSLGGHLGVYHDGPTLANIGFTQPPKNAADSILQETTEQKPNLCVGRAEVVRESDITVEIRLTARYKPDDEEAHETDQWATPRLMLSSRYVYLNRIEPTSPESLFDEFVVIRNSTFLVSYIEI